MYRYGFNGKEKDTNGEFGNTIYDYGFRIYDPSIAKFLSTDPLADAYPWYTLTSLRAISRYDSLILMG